ncbi:MAG: arylesterase [Saprospiraceae bacterium]
MKFFYKNLMVVFLSLSMIACGETTKSDSVKNAKAETEEMNNATANTSTKKEKKKKQILFFGDSLTAGYGLDDPSESFVGVIQEKIDSLGLDYQTVNAGVSGETSSGGDDRIDWILEQNKIDIFILELGANDGLRGIKTEETTKNLQSIVDKVKAKFPEVKLVVAGMLAPPNMGNDFTQKFAGIFSNLSKSNNAAFVPFLLDGVGGIPELNQRDGIHPTTKGHKILAENVWKELENML